MNLFRCLRRWRREFSAKSDAAKPLYPVAFHFDEENFADGIGRDATRNLPRSVILHVQIFRSRKQDFLVLFRIPLSSRLRLPLCPVPGRRTKQGQSRNQSPGQKYTKIDQNLTPWNPLYHCANKNDKLSAERRLLAYAEHELNVEIRREIPTWRGVLELAKREFWL